MVKPVAQEPNRWLPCPRLPPLRLDIITAMYAVQVFTVIAATGRLPVSVGRGTCISLIVVSWIIQLVAQSPSFNKKRA
ncbi:MAG: hypothetical protein S4CHLAM2_11460 [Chlamydiales bacterium]|nr:hypothetical protein [Chlamydiales bacterium]